MRTSICLRPATFPNSIDEQALNEIKLDLAILKYARYARGGRTVPVQLNKLYGMTPSLRDPKTVLTEIADAPEPSVYLASRCIRSMCSSSACIRRLLKARAESEAGAKPANMQKIVVNMERWRWMPENLGSLHILLNVPAFMVYVARDGKVDLLGQDRCRRIEIRHPDFLGRAEIRRVQSRMDRAADHRQGKSAAKFARWRAVRRRHLDPHAARAQREL